ncbi:MAG: Crp/Fnr family transcriptional regulator [Acidobacteriota bacterium]|nr:Crp/Fnr family transcriptional regulator [Acidobacteriota bacterium]
MTTGGLEGYRQLICSCPPFAGVGHEDLGDALDLLGARLRTFSQDELLLRIGDPIAQAGLVLEGELEGSFMSERFDQVDMVRLTPGQMFGEALACLGEASPMQIRAARESTVLFLDVATLLRTDHACPTAQRLLVNLALDLARKDAYLNRKVRIISQRSMRDRVLMYLRGLPTAGDGSVHVPLTRTELARYLNVNRSALSRELGRMGDEGVIRVDGRHVLVLDDSP